MKAWRRYLRFRGQDIPGDIDDELRFHLEARIAEYERSGMTRDQAERAARDRLGDIAAIEQALRSHDRQRLRRVEWKETVDRLTRDLRLAFRSLRRAPLFVAAVLAILSLGIGTAAAMFTIYKAVLVDRLPVVAQDRLVVMHPLDRRGAHLDVQWRYLRVIARDTSVFRGVAGVYHTGAAVEPFMSGNASVKLGVETASGNYFDVLGMRPILGRLFRSEDSQTGAPTVMVLSYPAWRTKFGGDSSVIGRTLLIPYTQQPARVVGIAPPGFDYPAGTDAWFPVASADTAIPNQGQADVIARLAPGITIAVARDELLALTRRVDPFAGSAYATIIAGVAAESFADTAVGSAQPALIALTLAVGLLLLIACVNVGNLVLIRLIGRTREIAVRRAIGASYVELVRLFAMENVLLSIAGGVLGMLTAYVLIRSVAIFAPMQLARRDVLASVGPPFGTAAMIALAALLIFGLGPSLVAPRVNLLSNLRADSRAGDGGISKRRARRALVATQIALALVLLTGAGLLVRTLGKLESMNLGFGGRYRNRSKYGRRCSHDRDQPLPPVHRYNARWHDCRPGRAGMRGHLETEIAQAWR